MQTLRQRVVEENEAAVAKLKADLAAQSEAEVRIQGLAGIGFVVNMISLDCHGFELVFQQLELFHSSGPRGT